MGSADERHRGRGRRRGRAGGRREARVRHCIGAVAAAGFTSGRDATSTSAKPSRPCTARSTVPRPAALVVRTSRNVTRRPPVRGVRPNSRVRRPSVTSRWSSPIPCAIHCPLLGSSTARNDGSSRTRRASASPSRSRSSPSAGSTVNETTGSRLFSGASVPANESPCSSRTTSVSPVLLRASPLSATMSPAQASFSDSVTFACRRSTSAIRS